ncbi:sulfur carrier protein ThiS, partial [Helicobacter ganmani]
KWKMQIKLNGNIIHTESKNVLELLQEYKIETKSVAVAINLEIVKQEKWDSFLLKENDIIECLTFMGGG